MIEIFTQMIKANRPFIQSILSKYLIENHSITHSIPFC
jgi:hypothetical protein